MANKQQLRIIQPLDNCRSRWGDFTPLNFYAVGEETYYEEDHWDEDEDDGYTEDIEAYAIGRITGGPFDYINIHQPSGRFNLIEFPVELYANGKLKKPILKYKAST